MLTNPFTFLALLDSSSEYNLIHPEIIEKCFNPVFKLKSPISVSALEGSVMASITHQMQPVQLIISDNHHEELQFYVHPNKESSLVLGFPLPQPSDQLVK